MDANEILYEYAKGFEDPAYIIENYFKTFDKTQEGFVPFTLFPRQRDIIIAYEGHRRNLVTKPRQAGVSTTTAAYLAVKVGFASKENPENVLIIANKQTMAFEFLDKIKDFINQLPRWVWGPEYYGDEESDLKSIYSTESKKELELPNGCRIRAVATSKDALRGFTPTYFVMDEAAFIENGDVVYGAAQPAMGTGGRSILISTPNGSDPLYYKTYEQSKLGHNDFNIVEMRWYEDLRYNKGLRWVKGEEDITETIFNFEQYEKMLKAGYKPTSPWYEDMCKALNNDARMIAQELDVSFVGSGNNVVDDEYIEFHNENYVKDPKFIEGEEDEFWVWEEPVEGHKYILSCDVSRGDGADYSVFTVLDFTSMEQVMEYQGKVQPDILAEYVLRYAELYNAYVVVDVIGVGVSTVLKLLELGCKNMHYDLATGSVLKDTRLGSATTSNNKVPGLNVSRIRSVMISHLEFCIREAVIKIRSKRITSELKTFVYKNGKPDHKKGSNDDTIQCLAMGLWVFEHHFKQLEASKKQDKAMLTSWVTNNGAVTSQSPSEQYKGSTYDKKTFNNSDAYVNKNNQSIGGDNMWLFSGLK